MFIFILFSASAFCLHAQTSKAFVPNENDTLYYLIDYNPLYTEDNTKGYLHDFMNLSGPCLTKMIYTHDGNACSVEEYGSTSNYRKIKTKYTKTNIDGSGLYGTTYDMHMDYKDRFTDLGPFDFKSLQTLVSDVEIRIAYKDLEDSQKANIGECVEIILDAKHTIRIMPKGKHELLLPGVDALANRIQMDESVIARSGIVTESNGRKRRLNINQVQMLFEPYKRKKYLYFATDNARKLLEIHLEEDRIEKIEYAAEIFRPHLPECDEEDSNVYLFPNPTLGEVRLHFENYPAGDYVLDIYNIIGKRLSSMDVSLDPDELEVFVILPDLKKGTYIYSIKNMEGERLVSRRLSIITF